MSVNLPGGPKATRPDIRPIEAAIAAAHHSRQLAETRRDRAQARMAELDRQLRYLRAERDRLLSGHVPIFLAHAELVHTAGLAYWQVDPCPVCGGRHRHGGSEDVPSLEPRRSHCRAPFTAREYRLAVPATEPF